MTIIPIQLLSFLAKWRFGHHGVPVVGSRRPRLAPRRVERSLPGQASLGSTSRAPVKTPSRIARDARCNMPLA